MHNNLNNLNNLAAVNNLGAVDNRKVIVAITSGYRSHLRLFTTDQVIATNNLRNLSYFTDHGALSAIQIAKQFSVGSVWSMTSRSSSVGSGMENSQKRMVF